ncbi:MAG: ATPase [Saprospiraceae bacterium]|nr:ATPase [Saprospiraceae bacterium]
MVNVQTKTIINRPVKEVSLYAANPDHAPEWYVNIKSVVWKTKPPLSVGSEIAFEAHFLGRKLSYTYVISEYIPHEKLVMRTAEGPFPMETTYKWRAIDLDSTEMKLRNQGSPRGFSKIMAPFMTLAMRRANKKDLKLLKEILEKS